MTEQKILPKRYTALGQDYGLIISPLNGEVFATLDGKSIVPLGFSADNLFYDEQNQELYFTHGNCLCTRNKLIRTFETKERGLSRTSRGLLISLENKIVDSEGKVIANNTQDVVRGAVEFRGELFHVENKKSRYLKGARGLVKTVAKKTIETVGWGARGLSVLDRLYFVGDSQTILAYDGKQVRGIDWLPSFDGITAIDSLYEGKQRVLYAGSCGYSDLNKGVYRIVLDEQNKTQKSVLCSDEKDIYSITHAPIEFIKKLFRQITIG